MVVYFLSVWNIENKAILMFVHIAFPSALGLICGNSINNTLSLPEPKKPEEEKKENEGRIR